MRGQSERRDSPRSVLLLSPLGHGGGIGTWTNTVLRDPRLGDWHVVDTTRPDAHLGMPFAQRFRRYLAYDFERRLLFLKLLEANPSSPAWFSVSPGLGFLLRDLPLALWARRGSRITVVHFHGGRGDGFLGMRGPVRALVVRALQHLRVVVLSQEMLDLLRQHNLGEQAVLIANPIPEVRGGQFWSGNLNGPVLLPATQCDAKGTFVAIRAIAQLEGRELRLAGHASATIRKRISDVSKRLGVEDRVTVLGHLSEDAIAKEMALAGVVILPSASEGFPMVVLEALTTGTPVIATRVGACPDVLLGPEGPAGIVIAYSGDPKVPCRPEDLTSAISAVAGQAEKTMEMRLRGMERVSRYRLEEIVTQMLCAVES